MLYLQLLLPALFPTLILFLISGTVFVIRLLIINMSYKKSTYGSASGNSFFKTVFNTGNYGEFLTFRFLEKLKGDNKLLANLYVQREDGTSTEIDMLMIHRTGLYVIESKNYSGWIFGDEKNKNWTQSLKGGKKNRFYNPIWQNKAHITALSKFINMTNDDIYYSYIVFSERCELKDVSVNTNNKYVVKRNGLFSMIEKHLSIRPEVFTEDQVNSYYQQLKVCCNADDTIKLNHIKNIQSKLENN